MRNAVVVDTSIAIKWVLNEDDSALALALLAEWKKKKMAMLAPALLAYEASNTLYQNVRRGKITLDTAELSMTKVILAGLQLDFSQDPVLGVRAIELANNFSLLATYDAYYLALAERERCEFWTADTRMWNAVKGKFAWVRWMGDYHTGQN
jgi:predicted nucleic acid-binding protein